MGVLHRFEQRLEHVVSSAFARAFRSAVQPVEIASALQREIDNSAQILSRDRMLVPNAFTVQLSPSDHERLTPYGGTLNQELSQLVKEYVDEQRYTLAGPLQIRFESSDDLTTGRFRVSSQALAAVSPMPGQRMTETAITKAPVMIEVNGMRHPVVPPGLVIGRGSEADLRVNDPGVSRKHAEIRVASHGDQITVSVVDLGSTNGTLVDGRRVQQALLRDGSEIKLGGTSILVRNPHAPGSSEGGTA